MSEFETPTALQKVLSEFEIVRLEDLPIGAQMERMDRKYAFDVSEIPHILSSLNESYYIMMAGGKMISLYESTYLDTADFQLFQMHQRGYLGRDKIRYRYYPNTNTRFLEIKHKTNKGRTIKKRIPRTNASTELDSVSRKFLSKNLDNVKPDALQPSIHVDYRRIQFVSKAGNERFSVDFNIKASFVKKSFNFNNIAILEVKQDHRFSSPVIFRMRDLRYFEVSLSKYCLATSRLEPRLKFNRFKEGLRRLSKLKYG